MRIRRPRSWIQWARRGTQAAFLVIFIGLLLATRFRESGTLNPALKAFFYFDPLVLAATWLATHTVPAGCLFALATLAATLVFGRVFCGWVCPLGTVHAAASWFRSRPKPGVPRQVKSPWQRTKYFVLVALLVMATFGAHWIGVVDPLSLLYRSVSTAVLPAAQYAVDDASTAVYDADPGIGSLKLTAVTEPVYKFFRDDVFVTPRRAFRGSTIIFAIFVAIVLLNLYRPRFWCRYLCPLGALLGVCSKRPLMRLHSDETRCNNCGRCNQVCPAAAQPDQPGKWLPTECFGCWNCVAACNFNGLSFKFEAPFTNPRTDAVDVSKRAVLAAGAGGVAGLLAMRLTPHAQAERYNPSLIRPPGSREERAFLQRCIQCGMCMKVCPTGGLQPAGIEAGVEGLWTPVLVPKIGYCEHNCALCGQVCPTGAIEHLPIPEKQERRIGLATVDTTRCLPYAYGRECVICEEHCPLDTKAIYLVDATVRTRDGATKIVKQPRVDPELCIGCGICENVCVFADRAAIRVTSANETRHPDNQPILPGVDPYGY